MQKTCFFVNYFLKDDYFVFDKWHYGPYSHAVDIVAKGIKKFQIYYGIKSTEETYKQAYQVVVSEKTNKKLEVLMPAIEQAAEYVNKIKSNKDLEGIATALFIIQKNIYIDKDNLIRRFKEWSDDKAKRFSTKDIVKSVEYLENTGLIIKNICGYYEIEK